MDYSKCGRRFDREFKENAVALVKSGRTKAQVSRELGVSVWTLGQWIVAQGRGEALSQSKAMAAETPEQREIRRLRQQCEHLTRQRDILKKALGILSAEMPPSDTR